MSRSCHADSGRFWRKSAPSLPRHSVHLSSSALTHLPMLRPPHFEAASATSGQAVYSHATNDGMDRDR